MAFYKGDREGEFVYVCTKDECHPNYGDKKGSWIRKAEVVKCDTDKKFLWKRFFSRKNHITHK